MRSRLITICRKYYILIFLILLFAIVYSILGVVRHNHYGSFGFDLGIDDQIVWQYSQLKAPINTVDHASFQLSLFDHVEVIYIVIAPFYWLWNDVRILIIIQALFFVTSAIPVYFLGIKHKLRQSLVIVIVVSYLTFYGVQNALWFDVHSTVFSAAALTWLIYFFDIKKYKLAIIPFLIGITAKENVGPYIFLISLVFYISTRKKEYLYFLTGALLYTLLLFAIYYPLVVPGGYQYQSSQTGLATFDPRLLVSTAEKRDVWLYSIMWFGGLPLLAPLYLIPFLGNLASYFMLGKSVSTAQGLFLQYRIELIPLLILPLFKAFEKYKRLNTRYVAVYLLVCCLLGQYFLHLPLSYLSKKWFWAQPASVNSINHVISYIPPHASVVSQNNITPHLSHRDTIFTLWPRKKSDPSQKLCGKSECNWLTWVGNPEYLILDASADWDIRHTLANREDFLDAIHNMEKNNEIVKYQHHGSTVLYKIN